MHRFLGRMQIERAKLCYSQPGLKFVPTPVILNEVFLWHYQFLCQIAG